MDLPEIPSALCQAQAAGLRIGRHGEKGPVLTPSGVPQLIKRFLDFLPASCSSEDCTRWGSEWDLTCATSHPWCPQRAARDSPTWRRGRRTPFKGSLNLVPRQKPKTYKWINSHGLLALLNSLRRAEGKVISRCMASNKLIITLSDQRFGEVGSFVCEITVIVC